MIFSKFIKMCAERPRKLKNVSRVFPLPQCFVLLTSVHFKKIKRKNQKKFVFSVPFQLPLSLLSILSMKELDLASIQQSLME